MIKPRPRILLTNDDGIQAPGLWAAADALCSLGEVTVAAPREQSSGAGRSLPVSSDGYIHPQQVEICGKVREAYAVGGTPAQVVLHAVLEILPQRPDLVVSGINYGENLGDSITISGTVGAAMEAASLGIPGLAVSYQIANVNDYLVHDHEMDFSTPAYFTALIARLLLEKKLPDDVDLLKVDVPMDATPQTPWHITRLSRHRYYMPYARQRDSWNERGSIAAQVDVQPENIEPDSDIYILRVARQVSVTPLSLDLTSRVDLTKLEEDLRR